MAFLRTLVQGFLRGSNLLSPPDVMPEGSVRLLRNSRLMRVLGCISTRGGMREVTTSSIASDVVRALWTLFTPTADYRYAHVGTTLYRMNTDWGSSVSLQADIGTEPVSAANFMDGVGDTPLAFFTNSSGLGQKKDNGIDLRRWGILPPTAPPLAAALMTDLSTTIDAMNAAANWTVSVGLTAGPTDDTLIKQEGTGSVMITVPAGGFGYIARTLTLLDLDTLAGGVASVKDDDYIHLWVRADYPERVQYLLLDFELDTATVADAFRTNYYSIHLPGVVWLNQGFGQWSKLQVPKSSFQRFGSDTALSWATVKAVRIGAQITMDGACILHLDNLKLRGGTDIVGKVRYTACYRRSLTGCRGNPPMDADRQVRYTDPLTVDRHRVSVTISNIIEGGAAHPGDAQVTHIRLYRSIDGGTASRIAEVVDTTTSPYTDITTVVSSLLNESLETDNDIPPNGDVVFGPGALNRLFILYGRNDLAFSKAWEPNESRAENWPPTFRAKLGEAEQGFAGLVTDTTILVWSDKQAYMVQGYGADTFLPIAIPNSRGIVGRFAIVQGDGRTFFVSQDGIYQQAGLQQVNLTGLLAPFFLGQTVAGQAGWNTSPAVLRNTRLHWFPHPVRPFLLMLYAAAGSTDLDSELFLGKNPLSGQYEEISFDTRGNPLHSLLYDHERNILYGGDSLGHVYQLEDETVNTDDGQAIDWEVITASAHQGMPQQDKLYAEVVMEIDTQEQPVNVTLLYDKQAVGVPLGETVLGANGTASSSLPTPDPEVFHQDIALHVSGALTQRAVLSHYGFLAEAQPEAIRFYDSGITPFGAQTVVQGLWYTLRCTALVTVTIHVEGLSSQVYTLVSTGNVRRADRVFCRPGTTGRQLRVTFASAAPFRLYTLHARCKPYGTAQGYQPVLLLH